MRDNILELLRAQPFRTFSIYLTNGISHTIRHPDQVWVGSSFIIVGIPAHESPDPEMAQTAFVGLLHVAQLTLDEPTFQSTGS